MLLGVFHVTSYRMALHLHNEVPGIVVPDPVLQVLQDAGADAPAHGLELAREPDGAGAWPCRRAST